MSEPGGAELTRDDWLGGKLSLLQPRQGHRVGSDAALLVAAAGAFGERIVDVGAGVGAVGLALLRLRPQGRADLVEIDAELATLARQNAMGADLAARARILNLDVFDAPSRREAGLADERADLVVTNPPYFDADKVRVSPVKARAHVFSGAAREASLLTWIRASLALLAPGGRFVMIHRPETLAMLLAASENRLGALSLTPVLPRAEAAAHRLLVSGVKGSRAPLRLFPALVLHEADGALTARAEAMHRGELFLDWRA